MIIVSSPAVGVRDQHIMKRTCGTLQKTMSFFFVQNDGRNPSLIQNTKVTENGHMCPLVSDPVCVSGHTWPCMRSRLLSVPCYWDTLFWLRGLSRSWWFVWPWFPWMACIWPSILCLILWLDRLKTGFYFTPNYYLFIWFMLAWYLLGPTFLCSRKAGDIYVYEI